MEAVLAGHLLTTAPPGLEVPAAGFAALLLLATLTGAWAPGAGWSAAALAAGYVGGLYASGSSLDATAPAFGVGLLLAVELAHLSLELGLPVRAEAAPLRRRLWLLAGIAIGSAVLGYALLPLAAEPLPGGLPATAAGLAAAVGVLALLTWLSRGAV